MLFGCDAHPRFQAGLNIEEVAHEVGFLAVKVSEGIDSSYLAQGSADWIARARRAGLPVLGYHYLRAGNEDQQAWIFAEALRTTGGIPGMLDAEALTTGAMGHPAGTLTDSGGMGMTPHRHGGLMRAEHLAGASTPALTMAGIRYFLDRCAYHGAGVALAYLPHWFWQAMGSPSLAGLPPLWASSYPSSAAGTPTQLYANVTPVRWNGYGGNSVAVLQYADTAIVAGYQPVDADAFQGSPDQFAALINGQPQPTPLIAAPRRCLEDQSMFIKTAAPTNPGDAKSVWPQEWVSFGFDPPKGWGGAAIVKVTTSSPGGWIADAAWWQRPGAGVGTPNVRHERIDINPIPGGNERYEGYQLELLVPDRCDELELLIAAPFGAHFAAYYQT